MRLFPVLILVVTILLPMQTRGFDIGLVPLHEYNEAPEKTYGANISLHGSYWQVVKMRRWIGQIAEVPKGLETLLAIENSGHKLMIFHSAHSLISSGKASAPMSSALIDGRGESVDIYFNFDIPDAGSHRVFDTGKKPIQYTAVQNLYHELAHAMHMMQGTWRYAHSERQAIEEENIFRRQWAHHQNQNYSERWYVSGEPRCPESPDQLDHSWHQEIICF